MATSIHTYNRALLFLLDRYLSVKENKYVLAESRFNLLLKSAHHAAEQHSLPPDFLVSSTTTETRGSGEHLTSDALVFNANSSERNDVATELASIYLTCTYRAAYMCWVAAKEVSPSNGPFLAVGLTPDTQYTLLSDLFKEKNADYGDAWRNGGLIGVLVRLCDKLNRINTLKTRGQTPTTALSLMDSYLDAANYAVLAAILLLPASVLYLSVSTPHEVEQRISKSLQQPFPVFYGPSETP